MLRTIKVKNKKNMLVIILVVIIALIKVYDMSILYYIIVLYCIVLSDYHRMMKDFIIKIRITLIRKTKIQNNARIEIIAGTA